MSYSALPHASYQIIITESEMLFGQNSKHLSLRHSLEHRPNHAR